MKLPILGILAALAVGTAAPALAQGHSSKLDEALTQSVREGCSTQKVIIRTKNGYRAGMALSLQLHGDRISSEHPSIDAVSAEVHCDDLAAMQTFTSVLSISKDAIVHADASGPGKNGTPAEVAAAAEAKKAGTDASSVL